MRFPLLFAFLFSFSLIAGEIYWIPLKGEVEWGMASLLKRGVKLAEENEAEGIVIEISTFGGRLDAAVEMKDVLLQTTIPTFTFVNPRAISAGSLLALSTHHIYVLSGGSIGAATPVTGGMGEMEKAPEKIISYTRALFRTTAEARGHSSALAEAFVDEDIEVVLTKEGKIVKREEVNKEENIKKVICPKGKLLTLSGKEALEYKLSEGLPNSKEEFLKLAHLKGKKIVYVRKNWGEQLSSLLTNSTVASLLFSLGLLGLIFELSMPGWGVSGTLGAIFLILFFTGKYFAGLAGWGEIFLFLLGCVLLAIEIFLIPGFGVTGISGIILILLSLYLSLVKHPIPKSPLEWVALKEALYSLSIGFILLSAGFLLFLKFLPQTPIFSHLGLSTRLEESHAIPDYSALLGKKGKTLTPVRPVGKAIIEGKLYDVVSEGEFIEKNKIVKVRHVEGMRIVVEEEKNKNETPE